MKKLTRLMNYKAKQKKNIRNYNPFDTGDNGNDCHDGNDEMPQTKEKFQNKTKMKSTTHLEPKVHHNNYNKNTKEPTDTIIAHSTKTKAADRKKFFKLNKKPKQQQLNAITIAMPSSSSSSLSSSTVAAAAAAAAAKSRTVCMNGNGGGGNNINYASLDRMRNSNCTSTQSFTANRKRKWPYLWWKRYGRKRKLKTWRLKRHISCWRHLRKKLFCCCNRSSSHYQYNSDEDDDIDAKFKAYVFEMQRRDALEAEEEEKTKLAQYSNAKSASNKTETNKPQLPIISMTSQLEVDTNHATNNRIKAHSCNTTTPPTQIIKLAFTTTNTNTTATTTTTTTTSTTTTVTNNNINCNNRVSFAGITSRSDASTSNGNVTIQRRHSQHLPQSAQDSQTRRVWTWDDSLRSNSDRFLETLEEDVDISEFVIVPESITNTASTSVNSSRCSVTRSRPSLQQLLTADNANKADNDEIDDFVVIHGGSECKTNL